MSFEKPGDEGEEGEQAEKEVELGRLLKPPGLAGRRKETQENG